MKKVFNGVNFGMEKYLRETKMLDYSSKNIQRLIQERNWNDIEVFERLKSIYNFVRDEILFGYNIDDNISASKVLADGYGQCNTKGTLFMALLRACNIPCRVHGFTIDKKLQKGAMTGIVYKNAPQNVFHSWVEVNFEDKWYELEAFILDMEYLRQLQRKNSHCTGAFCGYGVAVKDFKNPIIDFDRNNTYIQSEGINQDFGVYDSPDDLLKEHHQEINEEMIYMKKSISRIIGVIMLIVAIAFIIFALNHPEKSFLWSNRITWLLYGVYFLVTIVLLIAPKMKK